MDVQAGALVDVTSSMTITADASTSSGDCSSKSLVAGSYAGLGGTLLLRPLAPDDGKRKAGPSAGPAEGFDPLSLALTAIG